MARTTKKLADTETSAAAHAAAEVAPRRHRRRDEDEAGYVQKLANGEREREQRDTEGARVLHVHADVFRRQLGAEPRLVAHDHARDGDGGEQAEPQQARA